MSKLVGLTEEGFRRVREATRIVLGSPQTGSQRRRQVPIVGGGGPCPLVHQFYVDGNPTSGTQVYQYTINDITEDVTIAWNDGASEVKAAFTTAFPTIDADKFTVVGGLLPNTSVDVEFAGDLDVVWPPVFGTNSFNNSAVLKIRKSGG